MSHPPTERTVVTDGAELHLVDAGDGPLGRAVPRLPRAGLLVAPPGARPGRRRLPGPGPRPAGLRPVEPARRHRGLRHPPPHRRPASPCSTTSARSGPCSSATTGARSWSGTLALLAPERVDGRGRHERSLRAPPAGAADHDHAPAVRRRLLLHAALPGARGGRGRPRRRTRRPRCAACWRGRAGGGRDDRPVGLRPRRPRLRRPDPRARRPARLAEPGRARPLRRRVHPHRLPGRRSPGTATSTATGS